MRNHNPAERLFAPTPSRKRAIEAMCALCMGCIKGHLEDGFKSEIRHCSAPHCPLHAQALLRLNFGEAVNDETGSGGRTL